MPPRRRVTDAATRRRIVALYREEGATEREIALALDLLPSTVHYWIARHDAGEGVDAPRPASGRPRATDRETDARIVQASAANPFMPATEIRRRLELRACAETVRSRLRESGRKCRRPARKPRLIDRHRTARLAFALAREHWGVHQWSHVVFSDEKTFCTSGNGPIHVWRPTTASRFDAAYVTDASDRSGRVSINVWACLCSASLDDDNAEDVPANAIHRVVTAQENPRGTLNAAYYLRQILEPNLLGRRGTFVFMHDRASVHTALEVTEWLQQNRIPFLDDWPTKGPDLNPVENLWAEIERRTVDRRLHEFPAAERKDRLWERVRDAFHEVAQDVRYVKALVASMEGRLGTVIRNRGFWTKY